MGMNFPSPAVPGQIFASPGGPVYRFDDPIWRVVTEPAGTIFVTPQLFGAKGDGVADDGPAIVAALAASKHVVFPPGDYLINGTILQPQSGTLIEGPGRLVKTTNVADSPFFLIDGKDNITIDGVGGKLYPTASNSFVYTRNSSRIKVTRCKLGTATERWWAGVIVFFGKNSVDVECSHNIMHGGLASVATGGDPMFGTGSDDGSVDGCDILYNVLDNTATEAVDINWDTRNFRIIGNHGKNIGRQGDAPNECIDIGGSVDGTGSRCRDGEVAFNFFELADITGNGVGFQQASGGVMVKQWSSGVQVHHNHIISKGQPGTNGVTFSFANDCVAHDNVFDWFTTGISYTSSCNRAHARDNRCFNITNRGLNSATTGSTYTDCRTPGNEFNGLAAIGHGMEVANFIGGDVSRSVVRNFIDGTLGMGIYLRAESSDIVANDVLIDTCRIGLNANGPRIEINGGLVKNCVSSGLNAGNTDLRVTGLRLQDNVTAGLGSGAYQALFGTGCTRLFINGLIVDEAAAVNTRGIRFLGSDNCYIAGLYVSRSASTPVAGLNLMTNSFVAQLGVYSAPATVVLVADVLTAQPGCRLLTIDTEAAAATDDCKTITYSGKAGDIMRVRAVNSARDVVMKDGTGNLKLAGDFTLNNVEDSITLMWSGTNWDELARSDNGA